MQLKTPVAAVDQWLMAARHASSSTANRSIPESGLNRFFGLDHWGCTTAASAEFGAFSRWIYDDQPSLLLGFGGKGSISLNKLLQGHNLIHLGQVIQTLGALFCGALFVVGNAKLIAVYQPSPELNLYTYSRGHGLSLPETPWRPQWQRRCLIYNLAPKNDKA